MSSTTLSTASAVPTACTNLYDTPNQDNTCAMPFKANHTEIMQKCCGDAKIVSYYNGCGLYCVALDQTIGDLAKCLFANGAPDADVFCSGSKKTTKTKDADVPATAQASVISGDDDDKDDDDKSSTGTASGTSTATGTSSSSSETSTESGNAAAGFAPKSSINTLGLAIGALLFSSMAAGAFQL
ncbi:hypothetical protein FPCIR_11977 [Fusarium pseudocircinatum]|jgi:hypothetical protein|nr:hypothetical protein J7337_002117 [Fusarium musae]KAF5571355.1 hypothetical protein FPANT_13556 [Fusarium pseudoanthophilum]KAF5577651.1 hypothetical protein FPCIR_11977 [Fusarium pseudocircinatum]RBQ77677.1 hypothetical protein FVER14953_05665 [Fusarium verticillioides]KAG9505151.1 hypothetical protein J7337_002117 [Fusarium musae]RBQ89540.1 hypothetical protein FVER53263_05665 [Fusarium verticillioides]